jgi:hypothetical protein
MRSPLPRPGAFPLSVAKNPTIRGAALAPHDPDVVAMGTVNGIRVDPDDKSAERSWDPGQVVTCKLPGAVSTITRWLSTAVSVTTRTVGVNHTPP